MRKSRPLRVDAVLLFACVSTSGGSSTHRGRVLDQAAQKPEQRLALLFGEAGQEFGTNRFAHPPKPLIQAPAFGCKPHLPRPAVNWVAFADYQTPSFQEYKHGPNSTGVRSGAAYQILLHHRILLAQTGQQHELIGRDSVTEEVRFGSAMHPKIGGT